MSTLTKEAAVKSKKVQPKVKGIKVKKKRIPMNNVIEKLRRDDGLIDNTITFHFTDGTRKVQNISKAFVTSEKGRPLGTNDILGNINALVHDYGADYFTLG